MSISQSTKRCTVYGAALGESDMWRPHDLRTTVAMAAAVTGIARCGGWLRESEVLDGRGFSLPAVSPFFWGDDAT